MEGYTYKQFQIGSKFVTAWRTITEFDVMNFVVTTGFIEPLFLDDDYIARRSLFRRRIAPGGLTFALAEGLAVQTGIIHGTGLAFMGIDKMRLSKPCAVGDSIRVEIEIISKQGYMGNKEGGAVTFRHLVKNRAGVTVMDYNIQRLISLAPFVDGGPAHIEDWPIP